MHAKPQCGTITASEREKHRQTERRAERNRGSAGGRKLGAGGPILGHLNKRGRWCALGWQHNSVNSTQTLLMKHRKDL